MKISFKGNDDHSIESAINYLIENVKDEDDEVK